MNSTDVDARRKALVERLSTFADLLSAFPLEGEKGDVAYDLLRQAAAQIASDGQRIAEAAALIRAQAGEIGRLRTTLIRDFRNRAHNCRTNLDAFDTKAASVWDFAADAVEALK